MLLKCDTRFNRIIRCLRPSRERSKGFGIISRVPVSRYSRMFDRKLSNNIAVGAQQNQQHKTTHSQIDVYTVQNNASAQPICCLSSNTSNLAIF